MKAELLQLHQPVNFKIFRGFSKIFVNILRQSLCNLFGHFLKIVVNFALSTLISRIWCFSVSIKIEEFPWLYHNPLSGRNFVSRFSFIV